MATEDGRIIINPYSPLSAQERNAVALNEAYRLMMRESPQPPALSTFQRDALGAIDNGRPYASGQDLPQRETIIARYLSGDPSAGELTKEQMEYAESLRAGFPGFLAGR
jgi:hypothetical protein